MKRTVAAAMILSLGLSVLPASAADEDAARETSLSTTVPVAATVPVTTNRSLSRPAALPLLYASYAVLQAYDVRSTTQALGRGASEVNPLMQGVAGNPAGLVTLKAATTVGTVFAAEKLWRRHRTAALALMAVSNGVMATIAANNARTLRQVP